MVIKTELPDPEDPHYTVSSYYLNEHETMLLRQYQIARHKATSIPRDAAYSIVYAEDGKEEKIELMLTLAGLNIDLDLT